MKNKKKLKVKCTWPKFSKKMGKDIDTMLEEGYVFNTYVSIDIDGMKKAFSVDKK